MSQLTAVFSGHLTAVSPLAVSQPDSAIDKTKIARLPRKIKQIPETVYFPAPSIRGKLRRCLRDEVRAGVIRATGNPKPFDLDTHFALTIGGVKGAEKEEAIDITAAARRRRLNPAVSLVGLATPWLGGNLSVGNAYPIGRDGEDGVVPMIMRGVRTNDFKRDTEQLEFLEPDQIDKLTHIMTVTGEKSGKKNGAGELKALLAKGVDPDTRQPFSDEQKEQLRAELKAVESAVSALGKELGNYSNSILMPLPGYEAIPDGTRMKQRMILSNSNETELGLFLAGLRRFARLPLLGAHYAHGCGEVAGEWAVKVLRADGYEPAGHVRFSLDDGFAVEGELMVNALARWDALVEAGLADFDFTVGSAK